MIEIEFTAPLTIQVSTVILAALVILAGLFKSKLEAVLLGLMYVFSLLFGYLHLASMLKTFSNIIPNFNKLIDHTRSIDPSLVGSWSELAGWMMFVLSAFLVWGMFIAFRFLGSSSNVIRGTSLLNQEQMLSKLKKLGKPKNPRKLGQYFIPEPLEARSLMLIGEPGTGKTQIIARQMSVLKKRNECFMCVDVGGDLYRKLGETNDSLIAPGFEGTKNWSPFSEIQLFADCMALAAMMIEKSKGESGTWDAKAIDYTADLLYYCRMKKRTTNRDFMYFVRLAPQEELKEALYGTSSMKLFEGGSEKMLSNIQSIVSQNLAFFDLLDPDAGESAFSFRQWVRERNSNLWLINDEASQEITLPLRRVAISLVIRESLGLGEDRSRRINLILDELPANGRIASLQNALAQGRKFGLNFQLGFQSLALLYAAYSKDETHAILGSVGHSVVLRTPDADTADYMSRNIGDSVTQREQVSVTKPTNSVTKQIVRETQRAVMPAEIQSLRDLNGYVKFAGVGWAKITIPIIKLETKNELVLKTVTENDSLSLVTTSENLVQQECLDDI